MGCSYCMLTCVCAAPMAACDQPAELEEIVTNRKPSSKEDWFESLKTIGESYRGGKDGQNKSLLRQPNIHRVASMLLKNESNKDCFKPIAVSIGPYHRNNSDLKPMEKLKASMAWQYMNAQALPMELLYAEVEKVAAEARKCYAEDTTTEGMCEEDFTRIMFVDGCFFLQFISNKKSGDIQMKKHDEAFVTRDLFLLENQLPFIVLKALSPSGSSDDSSDPVRKMEDFIRLTSWSYPQPKKERTSTCLSLSNSGAENVVQSNEAEQQPTIHLLQLLRKSLLNQGDFPGQKNSEPGHWHTYRSANELKKVGIQFRTSPSHRFSDVGFSANLGSLGILGELRLPPMFVDDSTKSRLLNLVAYEMCADLLEDAADVTSYICFLDALIDSAEDVMELRSRGILINCLGSDQQVADLFNQIADNLVPNPKVYASVNNKIEEHYKNGFKIWVLERLYTHFKAPWSRVSFVAGLIALLLTFLQTFYTIKQA